MGHGGVPRTTCTHSASGGDFRLLTTLWLTLSLTEQSAIELIGTCSNKVIWGTLIPHLLEPRRSLRKALNESRP